MKHVPSSLTAPISFLQHIISNGGPELSQYDSLNNVFDALADAYKSGQLKHDDLLLLQHGFGDECMQHTLHGHIKSKPYGYAGDFMIIDKIYKEQITEDDRFVKWDIFWNKHSAAKAVRNRKDYFLQIMREKLAHQNKFRLLDVASGPARDLAELYQNNSYPQLHTVCVDADKTAIEYAQKLNQTHQHNIEFIHKNIFRFTSTQRFDLVWSAGLFDYFNADIFVKLLRKFISWTAPGGEVIIGNFSPSNPSRNYMELIGDWFLQHRSEDELIQLALEAGVKREHIYIGSEMEGVNLFLHINVI